MSGALPIVAELFSTLIARNKGVAHPLSLTPP